LILLISSLHQFQSDKVEKGDEGEREEEAGRRRKKTYIPTRSPRDTIYIPPISIHHPLALRCGR
jgi:hypothetical protein